MGVGRLGGQPLAASVGPLAVAAMEALGGHLRPLHARLVVQAGILQEVGEFLSFCSHSCRSAMAIRLDVAPLHVVLHVLYRHVIRF